MQEYTVAEMLLDVCNNIPSDNEASCIVTDIFYTTLDHVLAKLSRVLNITHPGAVITVLYSIKHQQYSIMRIRNTLVVIFLECWFIPEVKCI